GHTVRVDIPLTVGIAAPDDTIMAFELDRGSALWKMRDEIELDEAGEETMGEAIATTQMDRTGWWMIGQELPETDTLTTGCVWPDEGASNDGGDGDAGQDDPDAGQDDAGGEAPNSEELCWMEATADGWRDGFDVRGDQRHAFEPPSEGEVCLEATARGGLCTGERCIDDEDDWPQEALVELDCLNDQAEPIGWDESVDVVFDEDTGTHVFSFDGEAGDGAIFRLRQEYFQEFAGQIELFAATGTRLASESFDEEDAAVAAVLPDDGQYLGVVEADDDATGEGTVELLSREVVEPGEIIEGELAGGEVDDYLVDAGDARLLNAAALGETESTTYAELTFYDLLGSPYDPIDVHEVPETGPVEVDDRSFHQLRVENPRSLSGPEDHEVQVVAVDTSAGEPTFDSLGKATHEGELDAYGERRFVEFDASEGDGLYLELAGRGDVSQRAVDLGMRIWRKGDGETWSGEEELYALGRDPGVLGAIDAFQTRIEESGTYVIEVFAEATDLNKTEPGAFELHFERASADSQITVGDEDCSDADTNSLNAALRAVEEDGTVTVCEGTYDSLIPGRIDRDGVTVEGAGVDQTTLSYKHPMYRDDGRRIIDLDARHVTLEDFTMLYELPAEMRDNGGAFISTAGSDRSDPARGLRVRNLDMETDSVGRPVNRGLSLLGSGSTDVKIEHTSIEGVGTGYRARGEDYTLEDVTIDSRDSSVWVQSKDLNTDPSNGMTIKESDINSEGRGLYLGNMRDVTIEGNSIETGGDDPIYLGLDRGGPSTTVIRDNELRSSESSEPLQVTQYSRSDGETREVLIADNDIASRDRATTYGAINLTNRSETTDMEVRGNVVDAQDGRGL
ncbi:MAG: right-handed parallel beta-helix repeat-containing protein, partial [Persicimonas sp.]